MKIEGVYKNLLHQGFRLKWWAA